MNKSVFDLCDKDIERILVLELRVRAQPIDEKPCFAILQYAVSKQTLAQASELIRRTFATSRIGNSARGCLHIPKDATSANRRHAIPSQGRSSFLIGRKNTPLRTARKADVVRREFRGSAMAVGQSGPTEFILPMPLRRTGADTACC